MEEKIIDTLKQCEKNQLFHKTYMNLVIVPIRSQFVQHLHTVITFIFLVHISTYLQPQSMLYRVSGFLCSRPNWVPPTPHPLGPRGETTSLGGEVVGKPNSVDGTDTLVLYRYEYTVISL